MVRITQEQKIFRVYTNDDIESLSEGDLIRRRNGEIFYIFEVERHYKNKTLIVLTLAKRFKQGIKTYRTTPANITPRNGDVSLNLIDIRIYRKGSKFEVDKRKYNSLDNRLRECNL